MLSKKDIPEIIKTAAVLFAITAISAGILAAVNAKTAPIIEKNEAAKQEQAMKIVLPKADGFESDSIAVDSPDKSITAVYKSTNDAGYVILASPNGYGGAISIAVGVSADGKVSGVSVISQSETAGLGAKCVEDSFLSQYIGKTENITVSKGTAKDNQINAISSATITSKAVTSGVNAAIEAAKKAEEASK